MSVDPASDDPFLACGAPLVASDAVACVIAVAGAGVLLQQRDPIPGIFFPGFWGLFGGGIEPGESEDAALARELEEELSLTLAPGRARPFTRIDFELPDGRGRIRRAVYELTIDATEEAALRLGEGRAKAVMPLARALTLPRVVPYDLWALWLWGSRDRVRAAGRA